MTPIHSSKYLQFKSVIQVSHNAKLAIHGNNGLTIGEQKNAIQNFYNPLLTEFRDMSQFSITVGLLRINQR